MRELLQGCASGAEISSASAVSSSGAKQNLVAPEAILESEKRHLSRPELEAQIEALQTQLQALLAIARDINANFGIAQLTQQIAQKLAPFVPFDELFISLLTGDSPDEQVLNGVASSAKACVFGPMLRRETPDHPLWQLLDNGWMWSENDIFVSDAQGKLLPVRAFINVPLLYEGRAIGVLHFDAHQPRDWSEDELQLARIVGEQVAATVQSTQIFAQRARQEAELSQSLAILQATQEAAAEGICLVDDSWQVVSFNRRFAELWEIAPERSQDLQNNGQVMAHVLEQLADGDEFISKIFELNDNPAASTRDEIALKDGRIFERYSAPAKASDGRSFGRIWTFSDISDRKKYEQQLAHQAFHDAVTGLPNRILLTQKLGAALEKGAKTHKHLAILFLDLDRFKVVNDSLGHDKGDQLLVQVAARLRSSLRPGDTAARFGGDEFVVLLEDVAEIGDATKIADRIAASLKTPFSLDGHEVTVTASIGIMVSQNPLDVPEDLLRKADVAMYRAKNSGKAQYQIFSEISSGAVMERLQLELDLHTAVKRGEITVFYQPIVHLETRRICGFEALARWIHPRRGLISPAEFIPLAEETGQIMPMGAFVLRLACEQAKKWRFCESGQQMHVNLSARQFEQSDLAMHVARILREYDLPPARLVLEITETTIMGDARVAARQLEDLKALGVGLSIDDFGTGYSSLSYLEFFPLSSLKVDRSFVARIEERQAIVRAIVSLGHALGLALNAEGIETEGQLAILRALGCEIGQGFLFSKPVCAQDAENLLQKSF